MGFKLDRTRTRRGTGVIHTRYFEAHDAAKTIPLNRKSNRLDCSAHGLSQMLMRMFTESVTHMADTV